MKTIPFRENPSLATSCGGARGRCSWRRPIRSAVRARLGRREASHAARGLAACLGATLVALSVAGRTPAADAFAQNRKLGRGVNILGYDRIWRSRDQARFQERYFGMLREAGFQSVRINLHPFRHMDPAQDHKLSDSWWSVLDWAVENALESELMLILDMHEFGAMGNEPEANKERFLAFWRQVAEHFREAPDRVLFEVLNEPSRRLTAELWQQYCREALNIIRQSNPTRTVIIGPAEYNAINGLAQLELPADDRNLIVTVHYYSPMDFTHQGASWAGRKDKTGVEWLGTDEEKAAVRRDFEKAQTWARERERPLLLGEFGVYDAAPIESRVRYLEFVARCAEEMGWSWAYWQFDSDFLLYFVERDSWNKPVLRALIPEEGAEP